MIDIIDLATYRDNKAEPERTAAYFIDPTKETVIVSNGGGQDSAAIVYKLGLDPIFRRRYAGDANIVVVMSDTGDEKDETYANLRVMEAFCREHGFGWELLTADRGFHTAAWQSLEAFYRANNAIGSQAYPKTCSPNLKSDVIYRWLAQWLETHYGGRAYRKESLYHYTQRFGKIRVIIGIAAGEESRMVDTSPKMCKPCKGMGEVAGDGRCKKCKGSGIEPPRSKWMIDWIDRIYPLVSEGMDRAACQAFIKSVGMPVPPPSNCYMCPFADPRELLWKYHYSRKRWDKWVALEAAKLVANRHMESVFNPKTGKYDNLNYGVYKKLTLPQALAAAMEQYGWMTWEQLCEHHNSHGHCTATAA